VRRGAPWAVLAIVVAGSACRKPSIVVAPGAPVVVISIDTLRADHLPLYGYQQGSTPQLDTLGRQGIVFDDLVSHCPLTLPAHASMLTGLLPPHHGVRDNIGFSLEDTHKTLATRFKAAGYKTGGAISAYVLRSQTGIAQGFEFFDDAVEIEGSTESLGTLQRDGSAAVEALAGWVDAHAGEPIFAFLHLYEPHSPYAPPERYARLGPYDGEIAYADELVARFLDRLKARGIYDRAVIVVTSDHGEGLKQHGEEEHGIFLYREAVHVPFIVRLPGGARGGTRIAGTAAQADIPATLLDLAGIPATGLDGASLRPALLAGKATPHPVYSETLYPRYHFGWSELYSATEERFRYIRAPRPELYDVGQDPGETNNLVDSRASTVAAMDGWLGRLVGSGEVSAPEEVSADTREKLQALGYIGTGAAAPAKGALPDPKDKIGAYEGLKHALALRLAEKDQEAVEAFQRLLAENPAMLDAWESLGLTLIRMGRTREGIAAVDKALRLDPTRMTAHLALAKVYALEGKLDLAAKHAEVGSGKNPGQGNEMLAQVMMDRGDLARAAEFARKSVAADGKRIMSHFILGVIAQRAGRYEEALGHFRRAQEAKKLQKRTLVRNLHANAADCLARLGREQEAEQEFLAEIPTSEAGRVGLAMLYRSQGRDDEARSVLGGLIAAQPRPSADAYFAVVRTFSILGDGMAAREWAARARAQFPNDRRFGGSAGR
jgi:arylsulfatase A-like enzyme/Tfp pilus assembly protein PilF